MQSSTERGPGSVARRNEPYKPNPFCLRLPRGLRGWTSLIYKVVLLASILPVLDGLQAIGRGNHICFAALPHFGLQAPVRAEADMPFSVVHPQKAGCYSFAARWIYCCSMCPAALPNCRSGHGQSCFGCFRRNCTCPPARFPTCPPSAPAPPALEEGHACMESRICTGWMDIRPEGCICNEACRWFGCGRRKSTAWCF